MKTTMNNQPSDPLRVTTPLRTGVSPKTLFSSFVLIGTKRLKKPLVGLPAAALALLAAGCAGYGTITKKLAEDAAIVRADINSPWGKQTIVRIGTTTNQVRITADGDVIVNGHLTTAPKLIAN